MREACSLVWTVLVLLFRSRASLEAEILILRHQLNIQRRHLPKRSAFIAMDRLIFVGLYRLAPGTVNALTIVKPGTAVRWHRAGFVPALEIVEIRRLIREMSIVGSAADPWRVAQARHRDRLDHRQVHGQAKRSAVPGAGEHLSAIMPPASRRWICSSCRRSPFGCCMGAC